MKFNLLSLLNLLLIPGGIIILLFSIIKTRNLWKYLFNISTNSVYTQIIFRINLALMIMFLIGYIVVYATLLLNVKFGSELVVGVIFLFGAVFVLVNITFQTNFLNAISSSNLQTIKVLVSASEARDPYTMGHSEHVANLVVLLYDKLPKEKKKHFNRDMIKYTGLLHDIGKLGIPEAILNNPGRLNKTEMDTMKHHPDIGATILNYVDWLRPITQWIQYHHERLDGKGYNLLKGKDIPFVSKMLAVADTYSSLVTERKYRKANSHEEALNISRQIAEFQLDKELVEIFSKINYDEVKACAPTTRVLKMVENYENVEIENTEHLTTALKGQIINKESGTVIVRKYLGLAERNKQPLTILYFKLLDFKERDDIDYHVLDDISKKIENAFYERLRKSDLLVRLSREKFLLVLFNCVIREAEKIIDNIANKFKDMGINDEYKCDLSFTKDFIEYSPDNKESHANALNFINNL